MHASSTVNTTHHLHAHTEPYVPPPLALLLLLFSSRTFNGASATTIEVINQCPYSIWPGVQSNPGSVRPEFSGFHLLPGEAIHISAPYSWSGRIWARTMCSVDPSTSKFSCATGSCASGTVSCNGFGPNPPASLAEFNLGSSADDSIHHYHISLEHGFNVPLMVAPMGFADSSSDCRVIRCEDEKCPLDEDTSPHTCPEAKTPKFKLEFCPFPAAGGAQHVNPYHQHHPKLPRDYQLPKHHHSTGGVYNVVDFGAKSDGRTDAAKAFLKAWEAACGAAGNATITVPSGKFLVSEALFSGPCNNTRMNVSISGTIVAPSNYSDTPNWITFKHVEGLSIYGGTLDGQGQALWSCKNSGKSCPHGATSLYIGQSKDVLISGLTMLNSEMFHMAIYGSSRVTVKGAKIMAPDDSPNTDGIHIEMSSFVNITGSSFRTGDDCISMGPGSTNVRMEKIYCGPGHGISIGSLGGRLQEAGVENITAKTLVFAGSQNGLRIKTWGKPNAGYVKDVRFEHAVMKNVKHPIVIDQNYCPGNVSCPGQSSGVKISQVTFSDVQGTSATQVAVKLDCSPSNGCTGIGLHDIQLSYASSKKTAGPAQSYCKNVQGKSSGVMTPRSCL